MKEVRWLPEIGSQLSTPVPQIEFVGEPTEAYPLPWAVVSWLHGNVPTGRGRTNSNVTAEALGRFMWELHEVPVGGCSVGSERWGYRAGEPVTEAIDGWVDETANSLSDLFDPNQVREAWRRLRQVPPASMDPCWIHTDLSAENIILQPDDNLAGVIDFGGLGVGDRSVDLLYAWSMFDEQARATLRSAACVDEDTWTRARAWAFVGPGLVTIDDYRGSMPMRTKRLIGMVSAVAAEVGVELRCLH